MNRRKFFAALAALPFVPEALKKFAEPKPFGYTVVEIEGVVDVEEMALRQYADAASISADVQVSAQSMGIEAEEVQKALDAFQ